MKEVEKAIKVYRETEERVKVFLSEDGKEFGKKKECLEYEEHEAFKKNIKKINVYEENSLYDSIPSEYYYASNQEELDWILKHVGYTNTYDYVHFHTNRLLEDLKKPMIYDWIGSVYQDGGDYRGDYNIYTLEYVKTLLTNEHCKIMEKLNEAEHGN